MSLPTVKLSRATELISSVAFLLCSDAGHIKRGEMACVSCQADAVILLDDTQTILARDHGMSLVARTEA